ncbi:hypothetical protein DTL21_12770 [Bremerella cremea]|uniref:Uncharacterized protein n=1 Tax=Blastopirellula marina TaxID=124 RepID=A0A2S8FRC0_9BACT|nr:MULTISPECIES: hypothetical protein [Pirellulaceae]PQO34394.1 hypothetical protein C5Y83_12765 [Blastopirellula marina]RCS46890.1 hypothetical protein DTL21_12770 [Bremerella cremea]
MSIGPTGMSFAASVAGSDLAQRNSSDVSQTQQATSNQARVVDSAEKAEKAAGVGDPDESEKISDRDGDGRRAWERPENHSEEADELDVEGEVIHDDRPPKDGGITGQQLDISG